MIVRSSVLAIALVVGFLGVATAQTKSPAESNTSLGHVVTNAAGNDSAITQVTTGWNYVHPAACTVLSNGVLVLLATDNGQWFTADLSTIAILTPACQTNHFVAFFVINTNGVFNQVFVWPF